uniref:Uncharacterized protein n=1 Tax=Glossina pallidipes TaxID=7398 RepID=A0A1B0AJE9_GLOPL
MTELMERGIQFYSKLFTTKIKNMIFSKALATLLFFIQNCLAVFLTPHYIKGVCPTYQKIRDELCTYFAKIYNSTLYDKEPLCGMTCEGIILKGLWNVANAERYKLAYLQETGEEDETDSSSEERDEDYYEDSDSDSSLTSQENL